jgi:hypothetical protein
MKRNTSLKGEISAAKIFAALTEQSRRVLRPASDSIRYDLAIEENGKLFRIQCKTGILKNGVVRYRTCSVHKVGGKYEHRDYINEIEYFGVYCPDNKQCYLVPISETPNKQTGSLRIDPPKNNNKRRITWAKDFEI